ncbi:MAG TPA: hypothetical protein P5081_12985 [Phycisphaerae bacterium]|nr:hypothetical protein [Phycisphaerae bacterium]HRW53791.1 hypothetical protein [Phycisphaerae bacterium]
MRAVRFILLATVVVTTGFWIFSYRRTITIYPQANYSIASILFYIADGGAVIITDNDLADFVRIDRFVFDIDGFEIPGRLLLPEIKASSIVVPFWLIWVSAFTPWLFMHVQARRRRRRVAEGACVDCGYLLIGNESSVCPECGRGASTRVAPAVLAMERR